MSYDSNQSQPPYHQIPISPYGAPSGGPVYGQTQNYVPSYVPPSPELPPKGRLPNGLSCSEVFVILITITFFVILFCGTFLFVFKGSEWLDSNGPWAYSPAKTVVQQYYDAIKRQDYAKAYSYVAIGLAIGTDIQPGQTYQDAYIQMARAIDAKDGKVSDYTISVSNIPGINFNVNVTRNGKTYEVHLQIWQEDDGTWKIQSIDQF